MSDVFEPLAEAELPADRPVPEDVVASASPADMAGGAGSGVGRLEKFLQQQSSDISGELTEQELARLGQSVVEDWERDQAGNSAWRQKAKDALDAAAQEDASAKNYPWPNASNVKYPLLTIAGLQFAARALPAIIRGDEVIHVKTIGADPDGAKKARANRVKTYLNHKLLYDLEGWEEDMDSMLHQLPPAGCFFKKVYYDPIERKPCIDVISGLRVTVPSDAPSLKRSPRITHDFDIFPHEIAAHIAAGVYREVVLTPDGEDDQAARLFLEQHRLEDLDDDGLMEPYIVTVDRSTAQVLRIDRDYRRDDVKVDEDGYAVAIRRRQRFVKYPFLRDPKGRFYDIGFGHLLTPIMEAVNTTLNQMFDAGHAQVAGGGFMGSEVRLQSAGQGAVLRFRPGEYKTVNATGAELRSAIYERTFPGPSPVLFQLLGMLLEAAKDMASVNDAITGDAARTAPVGTTLALIEQGLQVFSAIYKRLYRAMRTEYLLFHECLLEHPDPQDYAEIVDEEGADFATDMALQRADLRPVSDPTTVTNMQRMAQAQYVGQFIGKGLLNDGEAVKRSLEAANIPDVEGLMPKGPPPPPPGQIEGMAVKLERESAAAAKDRAGAELTVAKAAEIAARVRMDDPGDSMGGADPNVVALEPAA